MNNITEVLKRNSCVGIVGNRSSGKTMTTLQLLLDIKKEHPLLKVYVFGVNEELNPILEARGMTILRNKVDLLDLQITNSIIYVDEIALFFDSKSQSKQLNKLMRFFDRLEHLNCKFILSTAREGYFNKFMCSRITAFIVKETEYEALVNGTWLKERVLGVASSSDYRLIAPKNTYYVVTNNSTLTTKHTTEYNPIIDTKKNNVNLFAKNSENNSEIKGENISEKFVVYKTPKPFIKEVLKNEM